MIPVDYQSSRQSFLSCADQSDCIIESIIHPERGLEDEELALDIAVFGSQSPRHTIIISSGLHGVEGFAGAAIQLALLNQYRALGIQSDTRIVLLHALNPYGFSHLRRFDRQNIDCNRNFLCKSESYTGTPVGYAALDGLLNPRHPVSRFDAFHIKAVYKVITKGMSNMKNTIAAGQHDFPQGVFFGGQSPSWTFQTFQRHWEHWTASAPSVIHIDIHTGLGASGNLQLMISDAVSLEEKDELMQRFPDQQLMVAESTGEHPEYRTTGDIGHWCRQNYAAGTYQYLCAEFGTHQPISVLRAICRENQLYHWGAKAPAVRNLVQQQIREAFCPNSPKWQNRIIQQGISLVQKALLSIKN